MRPTAVFTRIGGGLIVLWLVSLLTFSLLQLVPGDPAELVAGDSASPERVEQIRVELGLDRPLTTQYTSWLSGIVQGDLGTSVFTGDPVTEAILRAAPATLSITFVALVIAVVVGVPAGVVAGLRQGSWVDRTVSLLATVGIAMPGFWVAMLLVLVLALGLSWLPATGYSPIGDGVGEWFSHIVIPAVALGLATAAELARHARGCVADVLERPYIRTARARGAHPSWLVRHHILRNAAIPVVTVLGLQAGRLLGGSIVIEMVCGIDGLGTLAINAILQRDFPILQGYVLLSAAIVVTINLVVDGMYSWLNPKVRTS